MQISIPRREFLEVVHLYGRKRINSEEFFQKVTGNKSRTSTRTTERNAREIMIDYVGIERRQYNTRGFTTSMSLLQPIQPIWIRSLFVSYLSAQMLLIKNKYPVDWSIDAKRILWAIPSIDDKELHVIQFVYTDGTPDRFLFVRLGIVDGTTTSVPVSKLERESLMTFLQCVE